MTSAIFITDGIEYKGYVSNLTSVSFSCYLPQVTFTIDGVVFPDDSIGNIGRLYAKGDGIEVSHKAQIVNKNTVEILL